MDLLAPHAAPLARQVSDLNAELDWFARVLDARFKHYFGLQDGAGLLADAHR